MVRRKQKGVLRLYQVRWSVQALGSLANNGQAESIACCFLFWSKGWPCVTNWPGFGAVKRPG